MMWCNMYFAPGWFLAWPPELLFWNNSWLDIDIGMWISSGCDDVFEDTNDECCGDRANKTLDNKLQLSVIVGCIYLTV